MRDAESGVDALETWPLQLCPVVGSVSSGFGERGGHVEVRSNAEEQPPVFICLVHTGLHRRASLKKLPQHKHFDHSFKW